MKTTIRYQITGKKNILTKLFSFTNFKELLWLVYPLHWKKYMYQNLMYIHTCMI